MISVTRFEKNGKKDEIASHKDEVLLKPRYSHLLTIKVPSSGTHLMSP
jgi:hypothetical protein